MNNNGGVWRTIGGRRVFIKDGQDLATAMKEKSNTLTKGFKNEKLGTFFNNPSKNRNIMFMNVGIDIIKIKRDNYYVILNRGVLITYD